jgi:hypothetical protein
VRLCAFLTWAQTHDATHQDKMTGAMPHGSIGQQQGTAGTGRPCQQGDQGLTGTRAPHPSPSSVGDGITVETVWVRKARSIGFDGIGITVGVQKGPEVWSFRRTAQGMLGRRIGYPDILPWALVVLGHTHKHALKGTHRQQCLRHAYVRSRGVPRGLPCIDFISPLSHT